MQTSAWVPEACTLPTAEQPLRVAEFDAVFAEALLDTRRTSPTRLRLVFRESAREEVQRLVAAESSCCSFFTFTIAGTTRERFTVDIDVPGDQVGVLDGLEARNAR